MSEATLPQPSPPDAARRSPRGIVESPPRPSYLGLLWALPVLLGVWWFLGLLPSPWLQAIAQPLVAVVAYVLFVHRHEHRPVVELRGGRSALGEGLLGALLGLALVGFALLMVVAPSNTWIAGTREWSSFSLTLGWLAFGVSGPVLEELLFRGLLLRYLELWLGSWAALALSSLLFAAWHLLAQQTGEQLVLRFASGLVFGAAYLLTRRLWMSIGVHAASNLAIGLAFGTSGVTSLLRIVFMAHQPWLFWDIHWGIVGNGLLALALIIMARRRGRVVGGKAAWRCQTRGDAPAPAAAQHPAAPAEAS